MIRAHRLRLTPAPSSGWSSGRRPQPPGLWETFRDDQRAVALKVLLIATSIVAAALLEGPW